MSLPVSACLVDPPACDEPAPARLSTSEEHIAFLVGEAHLAWKYAEDHRADARRTAGYAAGSWSDAYNAWLMGRPLESVERLLGMAAYWRASMRRSLRLATKETQRGDAWDRRADEAIAAKRGER
jgi:hypothetical protein